MRRWHFDGLETVKSVVPAGRPNVDTILIFGWLEWVVSGVIGGLVFEDAEGYFEEFVEDGAEDGEFAFAGGGAAVGEGF